MTRNVLIFLFLLTIPLCFVPEASGCSTKLSVGCDGPIRLGGPAVPCHATVTNEGNSACESRGFMTVTLRPEPEMLLESVTASVPGECILQSSGGYTCYMQNVSVPPGGSVRVTAQTSASNAAAPCGVIIGMFERFQERVAVMLEGAAVPRTVRIEMPSTARASRGEVPLTVTSQVNPAGKYIFFVESSGDPTFTGGVALRRSSHNMLPTTVQAVAPTADPVTLYYRARAVSTCTDASSDWQRWRTWPVGTFASEWSNVVQVTVSPERSAAAVAPDPVVETNGRRP